MVLVVSFVALAVLWPQPRLQDGGFRRAAVRAVARAHEPRRSSVLCGAIGVVLLGLVVYAGFRACRRPRPTSRRRSCSWSSGSAWCWCQRAVRRHLPCVQSVAGARPGRGVGGADGGARPDAGAAGVPRAAGPLAGRGGDLRLHRAGAGGVRTATSPRTWRSPRSSTRPSRSWRMALYGVDAWYAQGRGVQRLLQPVLAHLAAVPPGRTRSACAGRCRAWPRSSRCAGTVPLLAVMIGSVTFDGVAEAPLWTGHRARHRRVLRVARPLAREGPGGVLPARPAGGDRARVRLLQARRRRGPQRRRRLLGRASWRTRSCTRWCRSRSPTWPPTT